RNGKAHWGTSRQGSSRTPAGSARHHPRDSILMRPPRAHVKVQLFGAFCHHRITVIPRVTSFPFEEVGMNTRNVVQWFGQTLAVLGLVALVAGRASAQTSTGTVQGTVTS